MSIKTLVIVSTVILAVGIGITDWLILRGISINRIDERIDAAFKERYGDVIDKKGGDSDAD